MFILMDPCHENGLGMFQPIIRKYRLFQARTETDAQRGGEYICKLLHRTSVQYRETG